MNLDLIYELGWKVKNIEYCGNHKIKYFEFKNNTGGMRVSERRTQLLNADTLIDVLLINMTQAFIKNYNAKKGR